MSTEDEIAERLLQGYTPIQLINEGFKKSTVYKVNQEIKAHSMQTTKPEWMITNVNPPELRALPKQNKSLSFQFENTSDKDMYLYKSGFGPNGCRVTLGLRKTLETLSDQGRSGS